MVAHKDPAMLFFGRDFYEDEAVRLMSFEQEAIYMRLLWHAWREGSIPNSIDDIAAILGMPVRWTEKRWSAIAKKWVPGEPGRLVNRRLELERKTQTERSEKLRRAGLVGNKVRWGLRSPGDAIGIPTQPQPQSQPQYPVQEPPLNPSEGAGDFSQVVGGGDRGADGDQPALFAELARTDIRSKSKNRRVALSRIATSLASQGMKPLELRALWTRARQESESEPGGLLQHWLDNGWREKLKAGSQ